MTPLVQRTWRGADTSIFVKECSFWDGRMVCRGALNYRRRSFPAPARRIEEDIVLGRRHPRERLIEQDLCDLFETHRGDVRPALFELERMGLIDRIPSAARWCAD